MKTVLRGLGLAFVLALGLAGCASMPGPVLNLLPKSVANPVTKADLYQIENGTTIAFAALEAYRKACLAGTVDSHCRGNIAKIQVYTRQLPPLLRTLRTFVKENDQVNAVVAYNTLVSLIANFKAAAAANGVQVQ